MKSRFLDSCKKAPTFRTRRVNNLGNGARSTYEGNLILDVTTTPNHLTIPLRNADEATGASIASVPSLAGRSSKVLFVRRSSSFTCLSGTTMPPQHTQPIAQFGELVAAAFDEAAYFSSDPQEVLRLAVHAVANMLRRSESIELYSIRTSPRLSC